MSTVVGSPVSTQAIVSHAVPWFGPAPLEFLQAFEGHPRSYWGAAAEPVAIAGVGTAVSLRATGAERFSSIRVQAAELFERIEPSGASVKPRLVGGFAFGPDFVAEDIWSGFSAALFILPRYQLVSINGSRHLIVHRAVGLGEDIQTAERLAAREANELESAAATAKSSANRSGKALEISYPLDFSQWEAMVSQAIAHIHRHELRKVVLSRACEVRAPQPIDPLQALAWLIETYPDCYPFLIESEPGRAFFGATPEALAAVEGQQLTTVALAGSTARLATPAEDLALGQALLADPKERHEHALVVQALRDSLSSLTTDLDIASAPTLQKLSNIQHLRTPVQGDLKPGVDLLGVVERLHPTPALGGSPRGAALDLIDELESAPRGWYAGPVGWLDAAGDGAFAVAIRSAVSAGREARLFAGAGIVAGSQPQAEWDETALKFKPLLDALHGAAGEH